MLALHSRIARKGSDKQKIANDVARKPALLPQLFEGLQAKSAAVKFGCEKTLRLLSASHPGLLYPHFDRFTEQLENDNSLLKWGAIATIANMTRVDSKGKFERIFKRYFKCIAGPAMITAANTIGAGALIARNKPHLAPRIAAEILRVENGRYASDECVNIACGHAIEALGQMVDLLPRRKTALAFVKRQLLNTRPPVRRRAQTFLKKHAGE